MSDILDLRNWDLSAFDPNLDKNKEDQRAEAEIDAMFEKLKTCIQFYEDLDAKSVESELKK